LLGKYPVLSPADRILRPDPLVVVPFSQVLRAWDASPPDVGVEGHLLKRRVLPWYLLGTNTAILFGIWVTQRFLGLVILAVPCLLVITAMNIKMFKFCDRCGRSVQGWYGKEPLTCPRCGADLP